MAKKTPAIKAMATRKKNLVAATKRRNVQSAAIKGGIAAKRSARNRAAGTMVSVKGAGTFPAAMGGLLAPRKARAGNLGPVKMSGAASKAIASAAAAGGKGS